MSVDNFGDKYIEKRMEKVYERLEKSASGFVLMKRFNALDRKALRLLINAQKVEITDTGLGWAYRLVN